MFYCSLLDYKVSKLTPHHSQIQYQQVKLLKLLVTSDHLITHYATKITLGDVSTFGNLPLWLEMDGKEYYISSEEKNQTKAQAYCRNIGGTLFEPKAAQVNNDIINIAKSTIKIPWIWTGIHEMISSKGHFVYESDGTPIVWKNWKTGQPDGEGTENCVAIQISTDDYNLQKWHDMYCDVICGFVCERGKLSLLN